MLITSEMATNLRCCGPAGCGVVEFSNGMRTCLGDHCMAWQNRITKYKNDDTGLLADLPHLDGTSTAVTFGTCGLAPDNGDEPD